VKESLQGASDAAVLQKAQAEKRLVVTHDKDFGELAFRYDLPSESGVILFRLSGQDPETDNRRMAEVLESQTDWAGNFSVVDDLRIRLRPLP
jgi:predicted nuclease of predicted toxin-antitoxin system